MDTHIALWADELSRVQLDVPTMRILFEAQIEHFFRLSKARRQLAVTSMRDWGLSKCVKLSRGQ